MIHCGFGGGAAMLNITPVQNIFIIEYMPKAPEEYSKVYLYGLMQCCCRAMENADISFALGVDEQTVVEAFLYWQDQGLLNITGEEPLCIEYKSAIAAPQTAGGTRKYAQLISALRESVGTRVMSPQELSKIYDWIEVFGFEEAAAVMLVRHCIQSKGARVSIQYMDKTARSWADDGVLTADAAEARIRAEGEAQGGAKKILARWRKTRMATEDELALYKKWTGEWGMKEDEILAACPAVTASDKPTFAYLNGILESMRMGGGVHEYMKAMNVTDELARQAFARAGLKSAPGRREKDEIAQWTTAWHMDAETVLLAAEYAAEASRPFERMRKLMENWHEKGITTVAAARKAQAETPQDTTASGKKQSYFMNYKQRRYSDEELSHIGIKLIDEEDE